MRSVVDLSTGEVAELPDLPPADIPVEDKRSRIVARLAQIDAEKIRPSSEISLALALGEAVPVFSKDKLLALESEAVGLRTELAGLA